MVKKIVNLASDPDITIGGSKDLNETKLFSLPFLRVLSTIASKEVNAEEVKRILDEIINQLPLFPNHAFDVDALLGRGVNAQEAAKIGEERDTFWAKTGEFYAKVCKEAQTVFTQSDIDQVLFLINFMRAYLGLPIVSDAQNSQFSGDWGPTDGFIASQQFVTRKSQIPASV